jgi:hypothetical protein
MVICPLLNKFEMLLEAKVILLEISFKFYIGKSI